MRIERWFRHYRLLILAVLGALIFHGGLLLAGSYRGTYDAYVHIFFADHYARSWWNPWEPRWYTGFTLFSYPPLTHQLTALISKVSSLPVGFITVMLVATLVTTVGVYRFSRLWVGHRPALYAALLAVVSSSIAETVHVFGQLPTMFVIGVMLNALPFVWRWVDEANVNDLLRGWALLMVAAAGHHVTTLFGMVFFSGPILATILLRKFRTPVQGEDVRLGDRSHLRNFYGLVSKRMRRVMPAVIRCAVFGVGLIFILVITVLPYWLWSRSDPITQITIPHSSRDSFLENSAAGLMFFLIPWGVLLVILPYAFYKGFTSPNWILAASLAALALLGTGGTTPIPALLLRGSFYILTLDRFTFWGTILILPFAGLFFESLAHGRLGTWITGHFGSMWRAATIAVLVIALSALALFTANLTQYRRFQPAPVDMTPIVEFLAKDNHDHWRYMTLGLGDQMAWLSAQTTALNVEGNYHSARRLPELTSTPVERLDGAKFTSIPGLGSLQAFVTNPQRYNLKYIFVNDSFYEPLLYFAGWHRLGSLENNVQVWERADVPPLPSAIPAQVYAAWQRLMWGTLPVGSLVVVVIVFIFTGLIVPRFGLDLRHTPIIRRVVQWRIIRFWLLDNDRRTALPASIDWQFWRPWVKRMFPGLNLQPLRFRARYGLILMVCVLAGGMLGAVLLTRSAASPESTVLRYYDALDFQRFTESYTYLQTALTREEYLRWLSLRGGILASFAKLDNLYIQVQTLDDQTARADVTAEWLTALGTYPVTQSWDLRYTAEGWRLVLDVAAPPLPRETFITSSSAQIYIDLPLGTLDEAALARGTLDRALVAVSPMRVVYLPTAPIGFTPESYDAARIEGRFQGLISILGAVENRSPAPAQVTITAILRDKAGAPLAETNVRDLVLHQLWRGEVTPFRIDFTGADAAGILDLSLIESVDVTVQAVPTSQNLDRSLVLADRNTLFNSGQRTIDIPRILSASFDGSGALTWVEGVFLEQAIAPNDSLNFELPEIPLGLKVLELPIRLSGPRLAEWAADIPALVVYGYSR
jgi:hypothetical protein